MINKNIDIMDKVGNEDFWNPENPRKEYSHHMYRNSPYETCDSCGNCNGAYCDICSEVTIPGHLSFSIYTDTIYQWLVEKDIPEDVASVIAYSDSCPYRYKGYHLVWPNEDMLKEQYPELYTTITTPDTEVLEVIRSYMGKFDCYADLRDAVREHYNVSEYSSRGHISNQLEMYWHSCNHDHKIACGK